MAVVEWYKWECIGTDRKGCYGESRTVEHSVEGQSWIVQDRTNMVELGMEWQLRLVMV